VTSTRFPKWTNVIISRLVVIPGCAGQEHHYLFFSLSLFPGCFYKKTIIYLTVPF